MRLWIDSDYGFDDLAAIALCRSGGAEIAGISLVAGNAELPQVLRNAQNADAAFGWQIPLYLGADRPLEAPLETASYVLGASAMPSTGGQLPDAAHPRAPLGRAVDGMIAYLEAGGRMILALGPLTNLALLLRARPDLAAQMQLIWMGGAFAKGNHTAVAEFNAAVDPEAVAEVLAAGADFTMVGLECCREVSVTLADLADLRGKSGPGAQLIGDLYEGYIRIAGNGTRPMALYDPVAAALALDPQLAEYQQVFMAMETKGTYTRGMTVIEWRSHKAAPNARVAISPAAGEITCALHRALTQLADEYDQYH